MNKEVKELIEQLEEYASGGGSGLYPFEESVKALLDYINQLETNRDVVFTKEEVEKLLKQVQELDKFDTALESGLMLRRKHLENEILKKKIAQLETNRDELKKWLEEEKNKHYDRKWLSDDELCYRLEDNSAKTLIEVQTKMEILERGKEWK